MHFSGLMVSKSNFKCGGLDHFPEGEVMNLLVDFFEDCNEGIMSKETGRRGSTVKWEETLLERVVCVCVVGGEWDM